MKKAMSIFLSILMILCSCTGFAATALANNFSSEIDIQKALDKNKYDSSTPLTVTVEGTYILSSRLVVYSNTTPIARAQLLLKLSKQHYACNRSKSRCTVRQGFL